MKDCTFEVLSMFQNADLTEAEIAKHLEFPVTIRSLERRHLIVPYISGDGEPMPYYMITDDGREFVRERLEENRRVKRDFVLTFVSGFVVGVLSTLIAQWLIAII